ncbi:hypothetical protein BH18ACT1_BH18ACT1_13540 [soil metagenome]
MGAVSYRARADLRGRWRSWVALVLLLGLLGGLSTALAAGARRTGTAHPRLIEAEQPFDVFLAEGGFSGEIDVPEDFLEVGDEIEVEARNLYADGRDVENPTPRRLRVVGQGITPERLGARLSDSAVLDLDTLEALT